MRVKFRYRTDHFGLLHLSARLTAVAAAVVLLAIQVAKAQISNLKFNHLSVEQGLSHKSVYCVLQDSKGFVWFGTKNGLDLYDGYKLQEYRQDPQNKNTLPSNDIRALAEDNQGYIWVGTYDSGLIRLDRHTKQGKTYTASNTKALASNSIYAIHKDRKGNIWVGTFGGGLVRIDAKTQQFTAYRNQTDNPNSLSSDNILAIHEDAEGKLWLGTFGGGFVSLTPKKARFNRQS